MAGWVAGFPDKGILVGAHGDKKPDSLSLRSLDTAYELKAQKDFFDAWALFYQRKPVLP